MARRRLYVIGTFFSLALLFDGLSLVAAGMGDRRILALVREDGEGGPDAADTAKRSAADQERSNN
ncbi:hypothetical protein [Streptomyces sp. NPDC001389]|uniref:hypothetical protein n=1 Tax=unclassified Streptomyces TaxID=2593676 RepID=UPI0036B652EA